eukprot:2033907-Karenia_brevis.AAC.1
MKRALEKIQPDPSMEVVMQKTLEKARRTLRMFDKVVLSGVQPVLVRAFVLRGFHDCHYGKTQKTECEWKAERPNRSYAGML